MSKLGKMFKILVFLCLLFVGYYVGDIEFTKRHESAHQQIFRQYGIDSEVSINYWDLSGQTTPVSNDCVGECDSEQNLTEIIGYHWMGFTTNLWLMFFIFMIFYIWREK